MPPAGATFVPHQSTIAGNVILYGATGGEVFLHGRAGERFGVRNSGAVAVVEGVGDHGCEYMTGGTVVVLGRTGVNFAAGMSGGVAYVYDETGLFDTRCNLDMVDLEGVWTPEDQAALRGLIERHLDADRQRRRRGMILDNWQSRLPYFVKVMPIEYRTSLERMRREAEMQAETVSATEEVFDDGRTVPTPRDGRDGVIATERMGKTTGFMEYRARGRARSARSPSGSATSARSSCRCREERLQRQAGALHGLRRAVLPHLRLPAAQPHPGLERHGLARPVAPRAGAAPRDEQPPRGHRPDLPGALRGLLHARASTRRR